MKGPTAYGLPRGIVTLVAAVGLAIMAVGMGALQGCSEKMTTMIQGDRSLVQVTVGKLQVTNGSERYFYILRDPDTGTDYLAVVDAGIIELKPKPTPKLEKQ